MPSLNRSPAGASSAALLALTVVLAAAGFAVGRVLGARPAEPPPAPAPSAPAPPVPAPAPAPPPESAGPSPFADLVAAVRSRPVARGDGEITGRVVRRDGRPIEGAVVRAVPRLLVPFRPPEGDPAAPEIDSYLEERLLALARLSEARSGPDGAFVLSGIGPEEHEVSAWREGFRIDQSVEAAAGDHVLLVGDPRALFDVDVRRPDGRPAASALLAIGYSGRQVNRRWTPAARTVEAAPGLVAIRATSEDGSLASPVDEFTAVAGERPPPRVLVLGPRPGIRVLLTFPPYESGDDRWDVLAIRIPADARPDPAVLRFAPRPMEPVRRRWSARRGEAEFHFADLAPGRYFVGIRERSSPAESPAFTTVDVTDAEAAVTLVVPPPPPGATVLVRGVGGDGEPVRSASIRAWAESSGNEVDPRSGVEIRPGVYEIGIPAAGRPDLRRRVRIRSATHGERIVELEPGAAETVVAFAPPARLRVRIDGYRGSRYEGVAWVAARSPDEPLRMVRGRKLDDEGVVDLGVVQPGDLIVSVGLDFSRVVHEERVVATSGDNEVIVRPAPLLELVVGGVAGADLVSLSRLDGGGTPQGVAAGPDRRRFAPLAPGEYVIAVRRGRTAESMPIVLNRDREVRFEPVLLDAFRVTVADPEGALARAGFRDGDRIVAVDGEEIVDAWATMSIVYASEEPVRSVTVLRAGQRTRLSYDLRPLFTAPAGRDAARPFSR